MTDKNIFRDFAQNFYNNDLKKDNEYNNRLRDILQNLEIRNWDEFEEFLDTGMDTWLKNRIDYINKNVDISDGSIDKSVSDKIDIIKNNIEEFDNWMVDVLQTDYIKTKMTAKYYYVLHPEELDDLILSIIRGERKGEDMTNFRIDNNDNIKSEDIKTDVSKDVDESELNNIFNDLVQEKDRYKNDVRQIYKKVLKRRPDSSELIHYSNMLKYDIITVEKIEDILKNSDDYKRLKDKNNDVDVITKDKIDVDANIDINDDILHNDDYYTDIIDKAYTEILQRDVDEGGLSTYLRLMKNGMTKEKLYQTLRDSSEYKDKFGTYNEIFKKKPIKRVQSPTTKFRDTKTCTIAPFEFSTTNKVTYTFPPKIVYCMMGTNRLVEIKPYVESVLPYIDKFIFIDGGSEDGTVEYLKSLNDKDNDKYKDNKDNKQKGKVEVYVHPWQDRFSAQRNNYLAKLRDRNYDGWVICTDTDEHFPVESLKKIINIIPELEKKGNNVMTVQVVDVTVDDDDYSKEISRTPNDYWKLLVFKYNPNLRYEGEPHETFTGGPMKMYRSDIIYEHMRSKLHVFSRATENFYISNSNRYSEKWAEFRFLCTENGLLYFKDYWKLFVEHKLPKNIEDWIRKHKDDNQDSGDSELREQALLYFDMLPEKQKNANVQKIEKEQKTEETDMPKIETVVGDIRNKLYLDKVVCTAFAHGFGESLGGRLPETIQALGATLGQRKTQELVDNIQQKIKKEQNIDKESLIEDKDDKPIHIGNIVLKLEDNITKLLKEFEYDTGVKIGNIYISRTPDNNSVYVRKIEMYYP